MANSIDGYILNGYKRLPDVGDRHATDALEQSAHAELWRAHIRREYARDKTIMLAARATLRWLHYFNSQGGDDAPTWHQLIPEMANAWHRGPTAEQGNDAFKTLERAGWIEWTGGQPRPVFPDGHGGVNRAHLEHADDDEDDDGQLFSLI